MREVDEGAEPENAGGSEVRGKFQLAPREVVYICVPIRSAVGECVLISGRYRAGNPRRFRSCDSTPVVLAGRVEFAYIEIRE